jgi:hypothetical protein
MLLLFSLFSLLNSNIQADEVCGKYGIVVFTIASQSGIEYSVCENSNAQKTYGSKEASLHVRVKNPNESTKFFEVTNSLTLKLISDTGDNRFVGKSLDGFGESVTIQILTEEKLDDQTYIVTFDVNTAAGDEIIQKTFSIPISDRYISATPFPISF